MALLPVFGDIVQRPMLPADGFEPARDLALQQLDAIEDEPSQKLSLLPVKPVGSVRILTTTAPWGFLRWRAKMRRSDSSSMSSISRTAALEVVG